MMEVEKQQKVAKKAESLYEDDEEPAGFLGKYANKIQKQNEAELQARIELERA